MVQSPSRIIEAFRNGIQLPFTGEIYEYAANFDLQRGYAVKGPFDVSSSKYLIAAFKALRDPKIRTECILKAIQTFGSGAASDLYVPYLIEHDPGDTLWLFGQGNDAAVEQFESRILPAWWTHPTLRQWLLAAGRFGITQNGVLMPHMGVTISGLSEGNVHSKSIRYLIVDELWLEAEKPQLAGLIEKAIGRTGAYPLTHKIVIISQGGITGTDWDKKWLQTNQQRWAWQCDGCKKHQIFEWFTQRPDKSWAGMKWETNEFTRPNGRWNYTAAGKTARLECVHCGHQTSDTTANRRRLDDTHTYIATNPLADETLSGHQWPSIARFNISFEKVVSRYLQAKDQQDEHGYLLPLIHFYQQELAVNWDQNTAADYKRISFEPYEIHSDWKDESYRFMTVDCQKDFNEFWFVVRAWAANGESRQLDRGRLESWEQVAAKQAEWKVNNQDVSVDCGYEQTKVADECIQHGHLSWRVTGGEKRQVWICWSVLKGTRFETFEHLHPRTKARELKVYDRGKYLSPTRMPAAVGRSKVGVPFFMFSALHVSDILARHRDGKAAPWLCLPDVAPASDLLSFTNQMHSHTRVKERDDKGMLVNIWQPISAGGDKKVNRKRPGHIWDCEKMQIVNALRRGIIGGIREEEQETP
jgi:hypothetical protein